MKLVVSAALLALLVSAPGYPKQEPDRDKPQAEPKKEEPKKEESRKQEPERQQPQDKEKQQQQDKAQADRARQNDKQQQQQQQQQQAEKNRAKQDKSAQDRPQQTQRDEHGNAVQAQRDGGNRRAIKEQDFRAHFGREHSFRVARRDDRRFNYGGYWFVYNDSWPAAWSYDDDVYVDEIDGEYYLIDPVHPGIRLLVVVSD